MENTTMSFDLTSRQIKFRDILKNEFLELEIWAISDINPNRNMTHFTLESMEKALPNMKNKPIVASFNNGDFGSHDGHADYDKELQKEFWNVENGERILGWIRESDPVEIVEKDGLHWIKFRCVICVTYCYNQVKKLLKDKSKKVSVEITVHDADITDNGIEEIYDFTLNGVTILGSKNGKQVIEAIPDAHVSILEKIEDEVFAEQKRVLTFAYQKIDDENAQKSDKEVNAKMEENEVINGEPNCSDCGTEVSACPDAAPEAEACGCGEPEQCGCGEEKQDEACPAQEQEASECPAEEEKCAENPEDKDEDKDDDDKDEDDKDEDKDDDDKAQYENQIAELKESCDKYAAQIEELNKEICSLKDVQAKYEDYDSIKERMEVAEAKVHEYFCADLKAQAYEMMSGENINETDRKTIEDKCVNGQYSCIDDIKRDVAYAIYSARPVKGGEKYSTSLIQPIVVEQTNTKNNTMTREERIAQRNRNGK